MENKELFSHTIQIAGESFPVKLTKEEKEIAKEIEAEINAKISEFKIKYLVKTTKDILSMVLLTYAFEAKRNTEPSIDVSEANAKIERLLQRIAGHESTQFYIPFLLLFNNI